MAYLKYKEITKYFNFKEPVDVSTLPKYLWDYIPSDSIVLAAYKTNHDYGIFTNHKIILFDSFVFQKQIYTIPYRSISTISIVYSKRTVKYHVFLDSGYPVKLKFANLKTQDRIKLRRLHTCIVRVANQRELRQEDITKVFDIEEVQNKHGDL